MASALVKVISMHKEIEYLVLEVNSTVELIHKTKNQYERDGFSNPICFVRWLKEEQKNRLLQADLRGYPMSLFGWLKTQIKNLLGINYSIKIIE